MRRCEYLTLLVRIAIWHIYGNLFVVGNGLVGTTLISAGRSSLVLSPAVPLHHLPIAPLNPFTTGFLDIVIVVARSPSRGIRLQDSVVGEILLEILLIFSVLKFFFVFGTGPWGCQGHSTLNALSVL